MKTLIFVFIFIVSCTSNNQTKHTKSGQKVTLNFSKANAGHRLGGDVLKGFKDNTLATLSTAMELGIQHHESFKYWEFDVRETKDNVLIVHHDRKINKGKNIDEMTFLEIKKMAPFIPKYTEVMSYLNNNFKGRVVVEIKYLISDKGRQTIIDIVEKYRAMPNLFIDYLAFKGHFKASFPKSNVFHWCKKLKYVMKAKNHKVNLCKKSS